jgi:D-alanine-D-alanine ligase
MRIAFTHNVQKSGAEDEAEFDTPETVAAITRALRALGHTVEAVDVDTHVGELIRRLESFGPDLVFNTAEGRKGRHREAFYPALFEELGLPYTGSDAYTCAVTLDKRLSKQVVAERGVTTPRSVFVTHAGAALPGLRFPVIVKPNFEGSSKGISQDSVVEDPSALRARLEVVLGQYPAGCLIEEFIVGKDVVVPYLEAASPATGGVLAAGEYKINEAITGPRRFSIYDYKLKTEQCDAVEVCLPAELSEAAAAKLREQAKAVYEALDVRDLGRIDFRVTPEGEPYFIEVNALPSLEPGATIYEAARLVGLESVEAVLDAVIRSAVARWEIAPREERRKLRWGLLYNLKRIAPSVDGEDDEEAEYDSMATVQALAAAIESFGHEVVLLEATTDILSKLHAAPIDVAFNMSEGAKGRGREALAPALLEHLGIPYTGSDAVTFAVTLDKQIAKDVVRRAGVKVAEGFVMVTGEEAVPEGMRFPMMVKPVAEGSSKGVTSASVVHDEAQLRTLARALVGKYRQGALVETYLPGREFTVGVLGELSPEVLAPQEIVFLRQSETHPVYSFQHKQDAEGIRIDSPAKLDAELDAKIRDAVLRSFRALGCRDVARVDIRLDAHGEPHFIECNPLPGLTPDWSDLCLICKGVGIDYRGLIGRILDSAVARWERLGLARARVGGHG